MEREVGKKSEIGHCVAGNQNTFFREKKSNDVVCASSSE